MDTPSAPQLKTRVLYVVESFSTGVYAIVRDIACNLDPDKFEVLIIHSIRHDSPKDYKKDFMYPHIALRYIPMDSLKNYFRSIRLIRGIISEFKPSTIHLHSSKAGFLGRLAMGKKSQIKVLYSPHGFSFLRTDVSGFFRFMFLLLEKAINWYVPSRIVAVSLGEMKEARRITENTITINNFIDTKKISQKETVEEQIVVTTGRISAQKNPQLFNRIASDLPHVSFIWVGDGPLKDELKSPNITITGYVSRAEVLDYLTNTTIYLQTSLWEGMPVSILEAMATGLPIVASDIIGNRDLLENGRTGYLCNPADPGSFIERISALLKDESLQKELGNQARTEAIAKFDLHVAIEKYSTEYV